MTFDQWVDEVNVKLRARLGDQVRTEELSWDSAMWVGAAGTTAVTALADDEVNAKLWLDGQRQDFAFDDPSARPDVISEKIAQHLGSR